MSDTESERDIEHDDMGELQETDDDMSDNQEEVLDQAQPGTENIQQEDTSQQVNIQYIIPEHERLSSNMMSKYEFTNIVGTRAQQIDKYGLHFADLKNENFGQMNALNIAILEIQQKKCPLLIKRIIDKKHIEVWNPNHMLIPKVNIKNIINESLT